MGDPREIARRAEEEVGTEETTSDFVTIERIEKFSDGEERILRLLPPVESLQWLLDNPKKTFDDYCSQDAGPLTAWREIQMHFGLPNNGALPCRRMIGEPCPICEAYEEDIQSSDSAVKASAKAIRAKTQVALFVLERDTQEEGPFVWAMAPKWARQIYSLCGNPDYTIMYDPIDGHDMRVKRTGTGPNNTYYGIERRPKSTFLYSVKGEDEDGPWEDLDFDKIKTLVEKLPSLTTYNDPVLSYDHYEAVLNGELTIKEAYSEHFGSDEDTEFEPEEIEKEQEKEQPKRRRRRR